MSVVGKTYSFKALNGALTNGNIGTVIPFGGQIGTGQIVVANTTDHTTHDTAADGVVMPSFVAGDSGTVTIECQQTSIIHQLLLNWLNILKTSAMLGDVSNWATTSMLLIDTSTGQSHVCTGISPNKAADKTYAAQGGKVTWSLPACNIANA
jgi:hypothetical protein